MPEDSKARSGASSAPGRHAPRQSGSSKPLLDRAAVWIGAVGHHSAFLHRLFGPDRSIRDEIAPPADLLG
jgi:hypothetical protein